MNKYIRLFLITFMSFCFSNPSLFAKMNTARVLLTHLREGDYAHAGDKEAIHMVIQKVLELSPQVINEHCLDVGSGFGGTASFFYHSNFQSIYGVDIDEAAVKYAKERYPEVLFQTTRAQDIANIFEPNFFSFIYLFNVLYAIEDKKFVLEQLNQVAKPGAILALFDYTTEKTLFDLKDLAGKPMYPLVLSNLKKELNEAGWEIIEIVDLSFHFLTWYQVLLDKLENEQETLAAWFSQDDINKVKITFITIYEWVKSSVLGGAIIYAKKSLV